MDLDEIAALEQAWLRKVAVPPEFFGWEPYDLTGFTDLLRQALPHVPPGNRTFLDAGCGIGTKCLVAEGCGLRAHGIDREPAFLAEARRLGVECEPADVRDFPRYGEYGLVYVNHPLTDPAAEVALERYVHEQAARRSVLLAVNYDLAPLCPAHPPVRPCDESCPQGAGPWLEVARSGAWAAARVKP